MPGNKHWSTEQLVYLEKNYLKNDMPAMVAHLGRTENSIHWKASQLGILQRDGKKKNASYKKVINVTRQHHNFLSTFKNTSHIIRLALDMYMKAQAKRK